MTNQQNSIGEKIRQAVEKLEEAIDGWLARQGLKPQHVPVPIDRPPRRKRNHPRL